MKKTENVTDVYAIEGKHYFPANTVFQYCFFQLYETVNSTLIFVIPDFQLRQSIASTNKGREKESEENVFELLHN